MDIAKETTSHRRFCGQGEFDVKGFIVSPLRPLQGPGRHRGPLEGAAHLALEKTARTAYETTIAQFVITGDSGFMQRSQDRILDDPCRQHRAPRRRCWIWPASSGPPKDPAEYDEGRARGRVRTWCAARSPPASTSSTTASTASPAGRTTCSSASAASRPRPGKPSPLVWLGRDRERFPELVEKEFGSDARQPRAYVCIGPIEYHKSADIQRDAAQSQGGARRHGRDRGLSHRRGAGERRLQRRQRILRQRARLCLRDRRGAARGISRSRQGRASWCRSTTPCSPTCTTTWCSRARSDYREVGRAARRGAQPRAARASRRTASAITSASAAGTCRTSSDAPLEEIVDLILQVQRRRLFDRGRQSAPRARMARVGEGEAAAGQDPDPRRDHPSHHHRRASAAGRRPHRALRQDRRARERHRRHRLRLRPGRITCSACIRR